MQEQGSSTKPGRERGEGGAKVLSKVLGWGEKKKSFPPFSRSKPHLLHRLL